MEKNNLHPKHRITDYHKWFWDHITQGAVVLDVGCGNGALSFDISKKAAKVIGIDINEKNIAFAKNKFTGSNIEFIIADIMKFNFGREFDYAILSNILEHIQDRITLLKKLKPIAEKLLIRVPLLSRDWITLYKKEMDVEWRLDRSHFIEYTPKVLSEELSLGGFLLKAHEINWGEIYAVAERKD